MMETMKKLQDKLERWQWLTNDPWVCSPGGVLEDTGDFKKKPQCLSMENGL